MAIRNTQDGAREPACEAPEGAPFVHLERLLAEPDVAASRCDGCTACCTVMAVTELHKPGRRACDHVGRDGCRIHPERPESCRVFHCAWRRGVLGGGATTRPDELGVMFDTYYDRELGATRVVAFELWSGALEGTLARAMITALSMGHVVDLSRRDGTWTRVRADAPIGCRCGSGFGP